MKRWALLLGVALVAWPRSAAAEPEAFATVIDAVRFEATENALYLPFEGPRPPAATITASGRTLFIDIPRSGFAPAEIYAAVEHSGLLKAYAAAYDPEMRGVRLIIEGMLPLSALPDSQYRGSNLRFVLAPRDPRVTLAGASAKAVAQRVTTVPRDGSGAHTVKVDPYDRRWAAGVPRFEFRLGGTAETYAPQAIAAQAANVGAFVLDWAPSFGEWALPFRVARSDYSLDDPDFVGVSHMRRETQVCGAIARQFSWAGVQGSTGVGYQGMADQVHHSATPAGGSYLFADTWALHGPMVSQELSGSLLGPLGAVVEVQWAPWLMSASAGGPTSPWLTNVRVAGRLTWWPQQRLSLGFFYDRTLGDGYNRESSGGTLSMTFAGF